MKRILTSVILLTMVFALALSAASCKSSGTNTTSGNKDTSVPGGFANVDSKVLEALSNTGKVSVYYQDQTEYNEWDKKFVKYFEEVYNGTVDPIFTSWEGWEKKFYQDFMAGNSPDLIYLFEKLWPKAATRSLVYTTDELTEKGVVGLDHYYLQDKLESVQNFFSNNGKKYVFANYKTEPVIMLINEEIFTKYDVKSPSQLFKEGKWNYDTFLDCAKKTTKDTNDDGATDIWGYQGWDWNYLITSAGGQIVKFSDNGKVEGNYYDSKTMKGFQHAREVYGTYKVSVWNVLGYNDFPNGNIAMCAALPDNFAWHISKCTFKWSMVPYPLDSGNTEAIRSGNSYAWAVSSAAKNPQGAVNFIIAKNCFIEDNGKSPYEPDYSCYNEEQLALIEEYSQHCVLPIFMGVGNLMDAQYSFRDSISVGNKEITEVIETYKGQWDGQIEIENQGGES